MPRSQIKLIEVDLGKKIPAASDNLVLLASAKLGWSGISVELHDFAPMELPKHFVEVHRSMVAMQALPVRRSRGTNFASNVTKFIKTHKLLKYASPHIIGFLINPSC